MDAIKRVARQIQGALPVVGLLSRLGSTSGGIGNDIMVMRCYMALPLSSSHVMIIAC